MKDLISAGIEDLGESEDIAVIEQLVPLAGYRLVDAGCGGGRIARALAERGATVLGVEPDPVQAQKNRVADPLPGLTYAEAPAQSLPLDDASVDGVFFSYSLHHVPAEHMDAALAEAARVLKRDSGFLYVMEPLLSGTMEDVYRPFHDETDVRRLAYAAVERAAPRFAETREFRYWSPVRHGAFDDFVDGIAGASYNRFTRVDVDRPAVRTAFEQGRTEDGDYVFSEYSRVNLLTGVKP